MRQHFADRHWPLEHPGRHAPVCRWNVQKMRSESSEYARKTTGFFTNSWRIQIALQNYFEEHAQEVWVRNWMNPEMQTTLLNTHLPKLFATILKTFREQLKESDQLHSVEKIAGPMSESLLSLIKILKDGGRFWDDVNGGFLPEGLVLGARREENDWVHSEGLRDRSNARVEGCGHETVGPDFGGHRQVRGFDPQDNSIEVVCKNTKRFLNCSALPLLEAVKVLVSIMMLVSFSNKRKPLKLRHYDISRAHFQGTAQRHFFKLPAEDC